MKNLAYYCQRFSELNVSSNRKRGDAHYKPILLLSAIDLIARSIITKNEITVSDELIETFDRYWSVLASKSYKGGLHYPFLHLQNEGFWHLEFQPEFNGMQPKTINRLKAAVKYAYLDSELFDLLQDHAYRRELIDAIVSTWFSSNQRKIEDILQVNQDFQDSTAETETLNDLENIDSTPKWSLKRSIVRNAFFRKAVVHVYDYRCAFCRLKVTKSLNQNIVDGAHIKPFAQFYNENGINRIINGISFCKNHHWAFDLGWFAVDDRYKIIVSSDLQEESPHAKPMKDFHGESLLLPNSEQYFPAIEAIQWHRQNVFRAE